MVIFFSFAVLLLVSRHIIEDIVTIGVEGHFDIQHTTWCQMDVGELKYSQEIFSNCHRSLSLVELDQDARLVVRVRGALSWE